MNSVANKTCIAEKRYRDKLQKDKNEIRLNNEKQIKQNEKIRKSRETYKIYNCQLQKTKKTTQLQKKKTKWNNEKKSFK